MWSTRQVYAAGGGPNSSAEDEPEHPCAALAAPTNLQSTQIHLRLSQIHLQSAQINLPWPSPRVRGSTAELVSATSRRRGPSRSPARLFPAPRAGARVSEARVASARAGRRRGREGLESSPGTARYEATPRARSFLSLLLPLNPHSSFSTDDAPSTTPQDASD